MFERKSRVQSRPLTSVKARPKLVKSKPAQFEVAHVHYDHFAGCIRNIAGGSDRCLFHYAEAGSTLGEDFGRNHAPRRPGYADRSILSGRFRHGLGFLPTKETLAVLADDPHDPGHNRRCRRLPSNRSPADPTINYIKRLVGLPGEEVYIEEGSVWINGQRLEPPESLRGLKYLSEFPQAWQAPRFWGTADRPAKLGAGEYFVLGDFSQMSADSRTWQTGAAGHPSYAVPESHIFGVVTHVSWPPGRWRILR